MTSGSSFYSKTITQTYPLNTATFPIYLVSSKITPNGNRGTSTSKYLYYNAIVHKQGKGFLGFLLTNETTALNSTSFIATFSSSSLVVDANNKIFALVPSFIHSQLLGPVGKDLSLKNFTYNCAVIAGQSPRYSCQLKTTTSSDYLKGTTVVSSNDVFDAYGNVTQSTVKVNDPLNITVTTAAYSARSTWIPFAPDFTSVTSTRTGQSPITRRVNFTAYDAKGNLRIKINDPGDPHQINTVYTYNGFGEMLTQTVSAPLSPAPIPEAQSTSVAYDDRGQNVKQKCNALGQCQNFEYDGLGRMTKATDITGLINTYSYDGFGRLTSSTLPTGVVVNKSLVWDVRSGDNSSVSAISTTYYEQASSTGSPTTQIWHDSFGRKKISKTQSFQDTYDATAYDNLGNVSFSALPYFSGATPVLTHYVYDNLNRLTSSTIDGVLSASPTSYVYSTDGSSYAVAITSPQGNSSKVTDATGLVTIATDNGGTLNYSYLSSGQLLSVSMGGVAMVNLSYDLQGNKTQMIDKNAGTVKYTYDAYGRLTDQVNPNNAMDHTSNLTYNKLNQLLSKTIPTATGTISTTYTYNRN